MERRQPMDRTSEARADLPAAIALAAGAIAALALMARHPSVSSSDFAEVIREIAREGATNRAVHGGLMGAMAALLYGFTGLAARLGGATARAGVVAYGLGTACMLGAAVLSGLVAPDLAERYADAAAAELEALRPVLRFSHASNQALAQVGTVGWSLGIALGSLPLLRRGAWPRALGFLGLAAGLGPALALFAGHLRLHVHGMALVVLVQGLWTLGAAAWLVRPTRT